MCSEIDRIHLKFNYFRTEFDNNNKFCLTTMNIEHHSGIPCYSVDPVWLGKGIFKQEKLGYFIDVLLR